jgi:hypothetical protein
MALWDPHGLIAVAVGAGLVFAAVAAIRHMRWRRYPEAA